MRRLVIGLWVVGSLATVGINSVAAQVTRPGGSGGSQAGSGSAQQNAVTAHVIPNAAANAAQIDFANARPMPAPRGFASADQLQSLLFAAASAGPQGFSAGAPGSGATSPVNLGRPAAQVEIADDEGGIDSQEFGTSGHPFSTARAEPYTQYPYRASGKLFFNIGESSYVCSASLIKRGVIVTAAHCVANYGAQQFYSGWQFVPAYRNGVAPYQVWTAYTAFVMTSYYNGTDGCYQYGVICPNDVAVIILNPINAAYPGTRTGWYGYGWNGYGFSGTQTQITQIGYPVCLDNGLYMERNDSRGYTYGLYSNNTIIGSLMCGGSSGGPWLVNFGIRPALTGTASGTYPASNTVVGVTSWGYISTAVKQQGASPFTSGNIVPLVNAACSTIPAACS